MISPDLLAILRCPQTGQTLAVASAEQLAQSNARNAQSSEMREVLPGPAKTSKQEPVVAALVTEDHKLLYPVVDDIPLLLAEEAIAL